MSHDPTSKKESFLFNFGEHFQDNNSPQNSIHTVNNNNNHSETTTKPFEDVLDDLGRKIEKVDDKLISEIENERSEVRLNNSDKGTRKTATNETIVLSSNLKPAPSVKDVFKRIPTDIGMFSQDFARVKVQPSDIPQVRTQV